MSIQTAVSTFHPELFKGKTVLISGGTSGIGIDLACVRRTFGSSHRHWDIKSKTRKRARSIRQRWDRDS